MALFSVWELRSLRNEKTSRAATIKVLEKQFFSLKDHYPPFFFSQDVAQTLTQLRQEVTMQQQVLARLSNQTPFSKELMAFAHVNIPHVWLTQIDLNDGGEEIILTGLSENMGSLQQYINTLSKEEQFKNYVLAIKEIGNARNSANKEGNLSFEINLVKKR